MKRIVIPSITCAALLLFFSVRPAHANPFAPDVYGGGHGDALLLASLVGLACEYLAVRLVLGDKCKPKEVVPAFFRIHLVTFPLMHVVGLGGAAWFAELVPILVEPVMYASFLRKKNVEVEDLRPKIVGANVFSFLIGLVVYFGVPAWKNA